MTAPSIVRIAKKGEEATIFDFFVKAHAENGFFPMSSKKVIDTILRAVNGQNATIGLIIGENGIEAATGVQLDTFWYSDQWYVSELLNYVAPEYRSSQHAKSLLRFQKEFTDKMSVAFKQPIGLVNGIMTTERLEPKIRLFQREFTQIGAIFSYNLTDLVPEDNMPQRKLVVTRKKNENKRNAHAYKAFGRI